MTWVSRPRVPQQVPTTVSLFGNTDEKTLLSEVLGLLAAAKEMVVLCSFLMASREIGRAAGEAASRGVRVYVLTSAEAALSDSRWFLTESDLAQQAKHREALHELSQVARVRSAPNWHTKFVVVDPRTNPQGVLLSANLNSQALRSSPELGVRLSKAEVRTFFEIARAAFWSAASEIREGVWSNSPRHRDVAPPGTQSDIISTINSPSAVLTRLQAQLQNADKVVLTTYSVDRASPVLNMLKRLAKHGSSITIVCHPSPNNATSLQQLARSGCTVLGVNWLHAKLLDAGGDDVLMVSQNLDVASNKPRLETAMTLHDQRADDARAWLDYWIKSAEWVMQ